MSSMDPLLEVYLYENTQLLEQLEEMFLNGEKNKSLDQDQINEVFRIMHTIKGSSSMMSFDSMATLAHRLEDLFSSIREKMPPAEIWEPIFDLVLEAIDLFKLEMEKIQGGGKPDEDMSDIVSRVEKIHAQLKGEAPPTEKETIVMPDDEKSAPPAENGDMVSTEASDVFYQAHLTFQEDCGMETIRAFGVVNALKGMYSSMYHVPEDIDNNCDDVIAEQGFTLFFSSSEEQEALRQKLEETLLLKTLEFNVITGEQIPEQIRRKESAAPAAASSTEETPPQAEAASSAAAAPVAAPSAAKAPAVPVQQSFISVNVDKIDKLMALMGEIVTTESMVIKNPDIINLKLENFDKQARLLRKLTDELQDVVMSIRMVPISSTFHKMKRIVRDMCKKINKEANLVLIGEKTEVDKNVIDHLSDPLMHLIRNSMDHGLETPEQREAAGKDPVGTVTLEAKNSGGDVIVTVSDDGKGLDRDKLINKAIEKGLTYKSPSEISDREAYNFILMPGFSTKEQVTQFSGRGVGMDVVCKNIQDIGGTINIESEWGKGMSVIMHIPLTLAIIDGMNVAVGKNRMIIPILNIRESLEARAQEVIVDPDGNEMAVIRGECFKIVRLHEKFGLETEITDIKKGILILVESETGEVCLLVDRLIGEQQAVIKPIPAYISKIAGKLKGIAGCTILGDGSISLIIDINSLLS